MLPNKGTAELRSYLLVHLYDTTPARLRNEHSKSFKVVLCSKVETLKCRYKNSNQRDCDKRACRNRASRYFIYLKPFETFIT